MSEKLNQLYAKENNGDYEQDFMEKYMLGLVEYLKENHSEEIYALQYSSQEQNLDGPLKETLKGIILGEYRSYPNASYHIQNVYIKDDLDSNKALKEVVKEAIHNRTNANTGNRFVNPDLTLEIVSNDDGTVYYDTIELKSTCDDTIKGSSLTQVYPDEWTIFIYHTKDGKDGDMACGRYRDAVIDIQINFAIRTVVSFKELKTNMYNQHTKLSDEESEELIAAWYTKSSLKTFNNLTADKGIGLYGRTNRELILAVLDMYCEMSDEEKIQFRNKLTNR